MQLLTASLPHSRQTKRHYEIPLGKPAAHDGNDDDATVLTSNVSWSSSGDSLSSLSTKSQAEPRRVDHHALTGNYYEALADNEDDTDATYDNTNIAVDSGASDHFGDVTTKGTNRRPAIAPVTMASATGDCRTSIATDTFDLPLPTESLDFHVFNRGDVQRPLLSVGKICDNGCSVLFTAGHCYFLKDRRLLLEGNRDPHTGLYC